jgi:hypothetical protein
LIKISSIRTASWCKYCFWMEIGKHLHDATSVTNQDLCHLGETRWGQQHHLHEAAFDSNRDQHHPNGYWSTRWSHSLRSVQITITKILSGLRLSSTSLIKHFTIS